jgi:type IV pilus assembly protein PilC
MLNNQPASQYNQSALSGDPDNPGALAVLRKLVDIPIPMIPLAFFFESAALLMETGRPIPEALVAASDVGDPELHQIFVNIAPKLRRGASLCACLKVYENRFPALVMPLLDVGEAAGGLPSQAKRLGETFRMQVDSERRFKFNVYDPRMIFIFFTALAMIVMAVISYFSPPPGQSGVHAAIVRDLQILAGSFGMILLLAVIRRASKLAYKWQPLRLVVDMIKLAIPGFGPIIRNLAAARWARSFATLWSAGVNISTALEISARSALNAHYERALITAAAATRGGKLLSECLRRTELLPPHLVSIIATCEQIGKLDENLIRYASDMEREAVSKGIEEMNKLVLRATLVYYVIAAAVILSIATKGL